MERPVLDRDAQKTELEKHDPFQYMAGYEDGFVHPEAQITREELAVVF